MQLITLEPSCQFATKSFAHHRTGTLRIYKAYKLKQMNQGTRAVIRLGLKLVRPQPKLETGSNQHSMSLKYCSIIKGKICYLLDICISRGLIVYCFTPSSTPSSCWTFCVVSTHATPARPCWQCRRQCWSSVGWDHTEGSALPTTLSTRTCWSSVGWDHAEGSARAGSRGWCEAIYN